MGCQICSNSHSNEKAIIEDLLRSVQIESLTNLKRNIKNLSKIKNLSESDLITINTISVKSYTINLLTYSFLSGSIKSFKYLLKLSKSSITSMHQNLKDYNLNPLSVLCERNFFQLLKFYLPIYYDYINEDHINIEPTIDIYHDIDTNKDKNLNSGMPPIQVACLFANLPSFSYLVQFNQRLPHPHFDFQEIYDETGENCALTSVRSGSLPIVKYLFEDLGADFGQLNLFNENALQICAVCSSKNKENEGFEEIFVYLIEEVKIDPCYNFEEILISLEKKELVSYYEEVLKGRGVKVCKRDVDYHNRVRAYDMIRREERTESDLISSVSKISEDYFEEF